MRERELRLALICYGGISLAVYMHGITKEIWLLAQASRAHHDDDLPSAGALGAYRELLQHLEAHTGERVRVVVDIIAGSSAGGINGVFLADAIASGHSLEPLTDLWLERADVEQLLDPDARPLGAFTKFWAQPLVWMILRRRKGVIGQMVADDVRAEISRKLSHFIRARWFAPPFGGAGFLRLILDALEAMRATPAGPPLLPPGQPLDLFVTMTDFHGHPQQLRIHSPPLVMETEHRVTIGFSTRGKEARQIGEPAELAYAARATASFPGAFPPFHVAELDAVLAERGTDWSGRAEFLKAAHPQRWASGTAEEAVLIDGSVLANAPFAQAIRALRNRPARREIDRRFVYIDPLPGEDAFKFGRRGNSPGKVPGFVATLLGASSNIPREQPIHDNLEAIEARSQRIRDMREITDHLRVEVERTVETQLGRTLLLAWPTPRRVTAWRGKAQERASRAAGFAYAAYGHLKLSGIIDDLVATVRRLAPQVDADEAQRVRAALIAHLDGLGLGQLSNPGGGATPQAIIFFRAHDLRFRIRRLRFLARRLSEDSERGLIEADSNATQLRDAIYECLANYLELETAGFLGPDIAMLASEAGRDPAALLSALDQRRSLVDRDVASDATLCTALARLAPPAQRALLLAYLGFPLYDIATLPLMQGEGLDEFDPVKVDRISPEDAPTLRPGTAATLRGTEFNNFGAFFSRAYRENDYLWGRLHGAERMIDIVLSALPAEAQMPDETALAMKYSLFAAILAEERSRLSKVTGLIDELLAQVGAATA